MISAEQADEHLHTCIRSFWRSFTPRDISFISHTTQQQHLGPLAAVSVGGAVFHAPPICRKILRAAHRINDLLDRPSGVRHTAQHPTRTPTHVMVLPALPASFALSVHTWVFRSYCQVKLTKAGLKAIACSNRSPSSKCKHHCGSSQHRNVYLSAQPQEWQQAPGRLII